MNSLSFLKHLEAIKLDVRIKRTLCELSCSVVNGSELALTALGRNTSSRLGTIEKHGIKRADRLIGNPRLYAQKKVIYKELSKYFTSTPYPLIHIDWSTVYNLNFPMLRASIAVKGRAFIVYEQVFESKQYNSHCAHQTFLKELQKVLPRDCQPIICTDAGFKVPWLRELEKRNWYWLARVRGTVKCKLETSNHWEYVAKYMINEVEKAIEMPMCFLSKAHQLECRSVMFKGKSKGRKSFNNRRMVSIGSVNARNTKAAKEPWFLVTNLPHEKFSAKQVVGLYSRRMTIEESFRDTKNEYYGLGIRRSRSRSIERLEVILLIAMFAHFIMLLIGKAAEQLNYHKDFQANTVRAYRVLSYITLAKRIVIHPRYKVTFEQMKDARCLLFKESLYE